MPWEVIPCEQQRNAIYELDENGRAYDNVYELRKVRKVGPAPLHASSLCPEAPRRMNMLLPKGPMYDHVHHNPGYGCENVRLSGADCGATEAT